ncbi:helix-turn-helix domain-containing protein [Agathobaculum sp.]|uniref:helix-turn-helix domain-containing protein n=1 Tax=Agathobaculum sp. TaxID=2048138 RepID=UPI0025E1767B|nr:helix-turn-helix transcriptional regulator [Agathobaculum sp.]
MKRSTPQDRNVGAKIREFRVARSWTQSELAAQMQLHGCDLSREIIARIESGYRAVSVYEIDKFVEVFGITYDELFAH